MRYILTFFAALVAVKVSAVPFNIDESDIIETEFNLFEDDILDFIQLIPLDKLSDLQKKYENDTKLLLSYGYAMSEEFHNLVYAVEDLREHRRLVRLLQAAGLDVIGEIKHIHEVLGMKKYVPKLRGKIGRAEELETDNNSEGGLSNYLKEVIAILPVKEIKELHEKKLIESQSFAKFNLYVTSSRFRRYLNSFIGTKQYKQLSQKALEHDIDFALIADVLVRIIGYKP